MSYLLDTNVISEGARPQPDYGVLGWLASAGEDQLFLSVASMAELRHGIERMTAGVRRDQLDGWLTGPLHARFGDRILTIDLETADLWGKLVAQSQTAGRPIGVMDGFIAATAKRHGLTLVTRNTSDFEGTDLRLFNRWT